MSAYELYYIDEDGNRKEFKVEKRDLERFKSYLCIADLLSREYENSTGLGDIFIKKDGNYVKLEYK